MKKNYNCTVSDDKLVIYKDSEDELNVEIISHEDKRTLYVYLDEQSAVDMANNILDMFGSHNL